MTTSRPPPPGHGASPGDGAVGVPYAAALEDRAVLQALRPLRLGSAQILSPHLMKPGGTTMDPLQVSAQFAAYVWASQGNDQTAEAQSEAAQFAGENWSAFLPLAHEGLGRLLLKIAAPKARTPRPPVRHRLAQTTNVRTRKSALAGRRQRPPGDRFLYETTA